MSFERRFQALGGDLLAVRRLLRNGGNAQGTGVPGRLGEGVKSPAKRSSVMQKSTHFGTPLLHSSAARDEIGGANVEGPNKRPPEQRYSKFVLRYRRRASDFCTHPVNND